MTLNSEANNNKMIHVIIQHRIWLAYLITFSYFFMHFFVSSRMSYIREKANEDFLIEQVPVVESTHRVRHNRTYAIVYSSSWSAKSNDKLLLIDRPHSVYDGMAKNAYQLKNKSAVYYSQILQDQIVVHLLNTSEMNRRNASRNGLFVEAGAFDGETWSNTLHLERFKSWTGLLIEPSKENYDVLRKKNRNAYSVNTCLCSGDEARQSYYIEAGPFSKTSYSSSSSSSSSFVSSSSTSSSSFNSAQKITCHPLARVLDNFFDQSKYLKKKQSKLSADLSSNRNVKHIDYMSLDVEGSEEDILKSFPWSRYQFNLLNIEYNQNQTLYKWIKSFMKPFGYEETIVDDVWYQDLHLAHKSVLPFLNTRIDKVSSFVAYNRLKVK